MGFFKKTVTNNWIDDIKAVQSQHMNGYQILETWMMVVDAQIKNGNLLKSYSPRLPENLSIQGHIGELSYWQSVASADKEKILNKFGKPKLKQGKLDAYSVAIINQEVLHEIIFNIYAFKVLEIGAVIFCLNNNLDLHEYAPYLEAKDSVATFISHLKMENKQYLDLFFGNDLILGKREATDEEIVEWTEQTAGLVFAYNKLASKTLAEVKSLIPWILGEAVQPNIDSFSFKI